jgi:hypothetical protein
MRIKVLILILAMGILIGVNYAKAQKADSAPTTEIGNEIEETNQVLIRVCKRPISRPTIY